jgi:hypothetical protein
MNTVRLVIEIPFSRHHAARELMEYLADPHPDYREDS